MRPRQRLQTPAGKIRATEHQSTEETLAPKATDAREPKGMATPDGLKLLVKQAHELKEYFSYYVTAKTDGVKLRVRNTIIWMVMSALAFVTLSGILITASWFVLSGVAGGLSVLLGDRLWIGNLATGVLASAGLGFGMYYAVAKRMRISRKKTIQKYEQRQGRQQSEFGHNICDQASGTASANK